MIAEATTAPASASVIPRAFSTGVLLPPPKGGRLSAGRGAASLGDAAQDLPRDQAIDPRQAGRADHPAPEKPLKPVRRQEGGGRAPARRLSRGDHGAPPLFELGEGGVDLVAITDASEEVAEQRARRHRERAALPGEEGDGAACVAHEDRPFPR